MANFLVATVEMAIMQKTYFRRSGRIGKNGRTKPGILAVDNKYQFVAHEGTKDGNNWSYYCKIQHWYCIEHTNQVTADVSGLYI